MGRPKSKIRWSMIAFIAGVILFVDQLYLFGIPFGGFLGDLSAWDITGLENIHHWMVGVLLMVAGMVMGARR